MTKQLSPELYKKIKHFQKLEMIDHITYGKIANITKNESDKKIIKRIAADELDHHNAWKKYTKVRITYSKLLIFIYKLLGIIMGYSFLLNFMERREKFGVKNYHELEDKFPEAIKMAADEQRHENCLIKMLNEDRLQYLGAIVLGLNDALVELTGAIAGFTFAFANSKQIAMAGIITGISATLSMTASNFLAERADGNRNALRAGFYTGGSYLVTVVILIAPYLLLPNSMVYVALAIMLALVIVIIAFFNFYIAVAKKEKFAVRFLEMIIISISVAIVSFLIGIFAKHLLGVEI